MNSSKMTYGAMIIHLLFLTSIGFAGEPPAMPDWPIGGATYTSPARGIVPASADRAAPEESQEATTAAEARPQVGAQLVAANTTSGTSPVAATPPQTRDQRRLMPAPEPSTGGTADPANSESAARSILKASRPAGAVYTTITALALVLGLFLLCMWMLRRGSRTATSQLPAEVASVVGRLQLAGQRHAELLKVGNKLVLIAITPTGAEPLTEVTDPVEVSRLLGLCQQLDRHSSSKAFEDVFRELSQDTLSEPLFGQESLLASSQPVANAYRAHRHEVGHA